jgi:hypothetical protein
MHNFWANASDGRSRAKDCQLTARAIGDRCQQPQGGGHRSDAVCGGLLCGHGCHGEMVVRNTFHHGNHFFPQRVHLHPGCVRGLSIFPDLLEEMCSPGAACFDDGEYRYKGPLFENALDGSTCIRWRNDRLAYFSAPLADKLKELYSVILTMTRRFELQPGQAYIVNNRRWLHGRDAFKGDREMWRYMINWSPPSHGLGFSGSH